MAISAQRFKFLDNETNVPTIDFSSLSDNQVYNNVSQMVETAIQNTKQTDLLVSKVSESMTELGTMLESDTSSAMSEVNSAVNGVIDSLSKIDLPDILKKAVDFIKKLSPKAIFDFFKDMLKAGARFLCNNLDFLKMFMLGFALNRNILGGLLLALLMSLLDLICKSISKEDQQSSSKLEILESIIPPTGATVNTGNIFNTFVNTTGDYLRNNLFTVTTTPMSVTDFITNVSSGNITSSLINIRNSELSTVDKNMYKNAIETTLRTTNPNTVAYKNLLKARGDLRSIPMISDERRVNTFNFSNVYDQLGSLAKNIVTVDTSAVNRFNLSDTEKSIYDKMISFRDSSKNSTEVSSRSHNSGSFNNMNFSTILPEFTTDEQNYLLNRSTGTSHRVHDMHPTTEVFLTT